MKLSKLQQLLLDATVQNALRFSFYREQLTKLRVAGLTSMEIFDAFSPVTKRELIDYIHPLLKDKDSISHFKISSGTNGQLSYRVTTMQELDELKKIVAPESPSMPRKSLTYLQLTFQDSAHGNARTASVPRAHEVVVSAGNAIRLEHAINVYNNHYKIPDCSNVFEIITGSVVDILNFTTALSALGKPINPPRTIFVYGTYLTQPLRMYFEEFWFPSKIIETFSVSEIKGASVVCPHCGALLNSDPLVVQDVLDFDTLLPVYEGEGLLSLTEFYPAGMGQPLLKYLSGDVVRILSQADVPIGCEAHIGKIKNLGRTSNCILETLDGRTRVIVSFIECLEVVLKFPVHREVRLGYVPLGDITIKTTEIGKVITIALKYDGTVCSEAIKASLVASQVWLQRFLEVPGNGLEIQNRQDLSAALDTKRQFATGCEYALNSRNVKSLLTLP